MCQESTVLWLVPAAGRVQSQHVKHQLCLPKPGTITGLKARTFTKVARQLHRDVKWLGTSLCCENWTPDPGFCRVRAWGQEQRCRAWGRHPVVAPSGGAWGHPLSSPWPDVGTLCCSAELLVSPSCVPHAFGKHRAHFKRCPRACTSPCVSSRLCASRSSHPLLALLLGWTIFFFPKRWRNISAGRSPQKCHAI